METLDHFAKIANQIAQDEPEFPIVPIPWLCPAIYGWPVCLRRQRRRLWQTLH
jgi:hypothetical protein